MRNLIVFIMMIGLYNCTSEKNINHQKWNGADTLKIFMNDAEDTTPVIHKYNGVEFKHPKFHSEKEKKYILKYYKTAIEEHKLFGIPASITLAQGILESASGESTLTKKHNAHFGIKPGPWTGNKEIYYTKEWDKKKKKFVTVKAYFRTYPSSWWSFRNRSHFLTKTVRYKPCFECGSNYKCWANQLQKCGYATDPHYAKTLKLIVQRNNLDEYDNWN